MMAEELSKKDVEEMHDIAFHTKTKGDFRMIAKSQKKEGAAAVLL